MSPEMVSGIMGEAIYMVLVISAPALIIGTIVGLSVSLFSAVTQIQDMTLTFVPKILAVFLTLMMTLPWIFSKLSSFTINLFNSIPQLIR